jgi:pimeloyl-ACP methyl ester carboxylesterase
MRPQPPKGNTLRFPGSSSRRETEAQTMSRQVPQMQRRECPQPGSNTGESTQMMVTENDLQFRVRRWGSGVPRLVLLHGFGDSADVWEPFASCLPADICAIAPDLRGHGESAWDPDGRYAFTELVADVDAILRAMDARDIVVIGHSLGAAIALSVVAKRGDVCGLVAVDYRSDANPEGASFVREALSIRMREFPSVEEYVRLMEDQLPFVDNSVIRWIASRAVSLTHPPAVRPKCDPAITNITHDAMEGSAWRDLCCSSYPKLLVRGQFSGMVPKQIAEMVASQLGNCSLITVPRAGHTVMLDNPGHFFSSVFPFVQECLRV